MKYCERNICACFLDRKENEFSHAMCQKPIYKWIVKYGCD